MGRIQLLLLQSDPCGELGCSRVVTTHRCRLPHVMTATHSVAHSLIDHRWPCERKKHTGFALKLQRIEDIHHYFGQPEWEDYKPRLQQVNHARRRTSKCKESSHHQSRICTMGWSNFSEELFFSDLWTGLATYYVSLSLYPVFNIVHFILTAAALRNENGGLEFAFKHPIASCVLTFTVATMGGILANLALAKPPLDCVLNGYNVFICVVVWYLIFFSPMDLCYLLTLFTPLKLLLLIIEDFARAKKVFAGVTLAATVYPNSLLAMTLVGMFKGSGKRWGLTIYHLSYDPRSAAQHELLSITYVTKAAFLCGAAYAYNQTSPFIHTPSLVLICGILFASFRLYMLFNPTLTDPFIAPQELSWKLVTQLSLTPRGISQEQHITLKSTSPQASSRTHVQDETVSKKQKCD